MPSRTVALSDLFANIPADMLSAAPNWSASYSGQITGLSYDSRHVQPGDIFFALSGEHTDGHRFIQQAVQRGARAVVGEQALHSLPVPYLQVQNSRRMLSHLSAAFFGFPARKLTVIGVTGTDGKTTTASLIYHILLAAGVRVGLISTVNAVIGEDIIDTGFHVTTPEATDIQRYLSQMVSDSISHVVLETTSHGLAQHRVADCDFDIGVVTNVTHEHLDYHHSYEAYRAAKASLFDIMAAKPPKSQELNRWAVINRDDSSCRFLEQYIQKINASGEAGIHTLRYGIEAPTDVIAKSIVETHQGLTFIAVGPEYRVPIKCSLLGEYNVSNCLAAIAATVDGLGIEPDYAPQGIKNLKYIPGRMEIIDQASGFMAIVDFAHTPNALERSLLAVRKMLDTAGKPSGRVIAVFGSAGLRDKAKRRMMAETSADLADITVLTAEDPRTESLDEILSEMSEGCRSRGGVEGVTFWRIRDRGEAIRFAVNMANPGDAVIALGKGHEQSMCFGDTEYPWDDRVAVRAAIAERTGAKEPAMPYLPTQGDL